MARLMDSARPAEPDQPAAGGLGVRSRQAVAVVTGAAGLLGLVSAAARPTFGRLAPAVPVGIDLGILVFSAAGLLLAYLEMPARWLRLVPAGLTGATVYLNVADQDDGFGVIAHAVLPGLWVLAVAIAEHVIRRRLALDTGTRMDSIRPTRWLLAPLATGRLWRRMVLWEMRSYTDAVRRERDRLLALTDLQDAYGRMAWRWRAPRRARALYRLGELGPAGTHAASGPAPGDPGTSTGDRPDAASPIGPALADDRSVIPDPAARSPRPGRQPAQRGRVSRAGAPPRSMDDLRAELAAAIDAGRIEPQPSAEAIRRALACAPSKARSLRDERTTAAGEPVPFATVHQAGSASRPPTAGAEPATTPPDLEPAEQEGAA